MKKKVGKKKMAIVGMKRPDIVETIYFINIGDNVTIRFIRAQMSQSVMDEINAMVVDGIIELSSGDSKDIVRHWVNGVDAEHRHSGNIIRFKVLSGFHNTNFSLLTSGKIDFIGIEESAEG